MLACPECGKPTTYQGLNQVECSTRGCPNFARADTLPQVWPWIKGIDGLGSVGVWYNAVGKDLPWWRDQLPSVGFKVTHVSYDQREWIEV